MITALLVRVNRLSISATTCYFIFNYENTSFDKSLGTSSYENNLIKLLVPKKLSSTCFKSLKKPLTRQKLHQDFKKNYQTLFRIIFTV